jgi:hypothetical protein
MDVGFVMVVVVVVVVVVVAEMCFIATTFKHSTNNTHSLLFQFLLATMYVERFVLGETKIESKGNVELDRCL